MLENVLAAWELSPSLHEPEPPASPETLAEVERLLGRPLPPVVHELYGAVGGGSFLEGNLMLHEPLPEGDEDESLATASDVMRGWDWPIPDEVVVFGGNGADEHFGLWLPADGSGRPLVVEIGEMFDEPGLAVAGDDLARFLTGWTAYYLALYADAIDTRAALAALGVPEELRTLPGNGTDEEFHARLRWASPGLTQDPDPYEHGLTAAEVAALAGRAT